MADAQTPAAKKSAPKLNLTHDVTVEPESDDNGEEHLVIRCDPCGYAQTVPAAAEDAAKSMARDHQR